MKFSRRDFGLLFPALAAARVSTAQTSKLPSKTYAFDDLPVRNNGANKSPRCSRSQNAWGFPVEMHITELAPGLPPQPPHHHAHEEMIMIREGTREVTIAGHSTKLGKGSVAYVASNEEHGWRNVGRSRAQYSVLVLGRDNPRS